MSKGRSSSLSEAQFDRNVKQNNKPVTTNTWRQVLGEENSLSGRGYRSAGVESRLQPGEGTPGALQLLESKPIQIPWKSKESEMWRGTFCNILVFSLRKERNADPKKFTSHSYKHFHTIKRV